MRRAQTGFTLLEMLVALLVFSALVSLVYGMLRIGSRSWESGNLRIEETDAMRIGWTFLHRALGNARAVPTRLEEGLGVHFVGEPDELEFVADMPAYLGDGGLHVLQLGLDTETSTEAAPLILRRTPLSAYGESEPEDPQQRQRAELAARVAGMELQYYGRKADDESPQWHEEWRDQNVLPVLVRLRVELPGDDYWPELVAHPRLGAERQEEMAPELDAEASGLDAEEPPDEE